MTAMIATPRLELIDGLIAADLEIDRLLGRIQGLVLGLAGARRHLAQPGARPALGSAYLVRAEDEYEEALGQLHAARREAQALVRIN